ncbi:hypothetical protein AQUSIP_11880 [Aquicella siphonis]|uniref:DUF1189 domain-containing protein n=1 Tax=Aquicella siphonis TaxID=254247 RepID=A0A5E4PHG2_9COXI|nr:DUF1189 family protein [Aquicella siphonis]VVC75887.1 hypothetical protein AQUSIP_11880 [Aquicella siphonis]
MQQYNILRAIYMSFYSRNLYRDVANNWGGKAFLYLFILVVLTSIYFTYTIQRDLNQGYQATYINIIKPQVPVITVENGKVITPENRPYFIIDPETHTNYAVIDTSGQYTSIEQAKSLILVTEKEVIMQSREDETKTYKVPADAKESFDPVKINDFIQKFISYLWIPIFIFMVVLAYLYRILQALLYSILGKLFALIFSVKLSYWQIVQIMMVAITPAIVLAEIHHGLRVSIAHEMLLYFLLGIVYLFYGIISNKN